MRRRLNIMDINTDNDIRFLWFKYYDRLNKLKLSNRRIEIITYIVNKNSYVTSRELAKKFNVSITNISETLHRLYDMGYLVRKINNRKSCSNEFMYTIGNW